MKLLSYEEFEAALETLHTEELKKLSAKEQNKLLGFAVFGKLSFVREKGLSIIYFEWSGHYGMDTHHNWLTFKQIYVKYYSNRKKITSNDLWWSEEDNYWAKKDKESVDYFDSKLKTQEAGP